jgi:hypothetical protein
MAKQNHDQGHRKYPRVPKAVHLMINRLGYPMSRADEETAVTRNIAEQGVCFTSSSPYEVGTVLSMKIDLQGWQVFLRTVLSIVDDNSEIKPLTAVGHVVWSKEMPGRGGYEVGVEFTDIFEDDYNAFKKYLHIIQESVR